MVKEINWPEALANKFPDALMYQLEPPMQRVLGDLSEQFGVDRVLETLTSSPTQTGGTRKFPFIRPDLITQVMCERVELSEKGGGSGLIDYVYRNAPVVIALFERTDYFENMKYPNPYGLEVAWFSRPAENMEYHLPRIKAQTGRLKEFLKLRG